MRGSVDHVVLVGGGHAHVAVLADWIERGLPTERATLITPHSTLRYSGMVPGWISGEHKRDDGLVDLAALANRAGAELVLDRCVAMDPEARSILTQSSGLIPFDIVSIDVGGVGQAERLLGNDQRLIDVRPIDGFVDRLADEFTRSAGKPLVIAVIGGGAGGIELAFALRNAKWAEARPQVRIYAGAEGLLPQFAGSVSRKVTNELHRQGIQCFAQDARIGDAGLEAGGATQEPVDLIVAAIGSAAPDWPRASGLAVSKAGYIAVDQFQRSTSHPHIYAAGDCAARTDRDVPHSGVHAVHSGPVLAANLRSALSQETPSRIYRPRPASLYLLSTGNGSAIASYGPLALRGRWVARLKQWIDTGWISKYRRLADAR